MMTCKMHHIQLCSREISNIFLVSQYKYILISVRTQRNIPLKSFPSEIIRIRAYEFFCQIEICNSMSINAVTLA